MFQKINVKVQSREMDQAKSGLIRKALLNGEMRIFSANFARHPSCESTSKIPRHPTAVGY